jgi:hypothetical protein
LSVYAFAHVPASLLLGWKAVSSFNETFAVGTSWTRLVNSGQLPDNQMGLTSYIVVPAGRSVVVFGPQLEPQPVPSRYRSTADTGGVYKNAHFLGDTITFESSAPGLVSTLISIETT